jgi:hypothetical protein
LLKIALEFKMYLWKKLKPKKTQNLNKTTMNKQVNYSILEVGTTVVVMDNHMIVIQVKIRKNTIEHVLLGGGFGINIVTKH